MELLFELRCQELPEGSLRPILEQLAGRLFEELMGRGLAPQEILTGITHRRLTLCCRGLPAAEADREEQELGPPLADAYDGDTPTEALLGFAERVEVEAEELEEIQTERGVYLGIRRRIPGRLVGDVLGPLLPRLLGEMRFAGRGTWSENRHWVRPLTGLMAHLDGKVLSFTFDGFESGAETVGHHRLSPQGFVARSDADYRAGLARRGIEVVWKERRAKLLEACTRRAAELGGELLIDDGLLDRLTDRCEIPGIVHGSFDAAFLDLPDEVILATLVNQQRALAVSSRGDLLPFFITVMDRLDDPDGRIQAGHQRAVAGRLRDARFYYEADRASTLAERGERLEQLVFHAGLGTLADKTRRVGALVDLIARELQWDDELEAAQQAAALAKTDLTTDMVREYPSLRGTTGGIYAREEGYVTAVWQAIAEHYRPASGRGPVPQRRSACLLAVADRLDTVVGFAGLGQLPKGKHDPMALRRLVQGLLRTLVERRMELDLDLVAARAVLLYGDLLTSGAEATLSALQAFFDDRVRHFLGRMGMAFDEIEAAMAVGSKSLPDLVDRLKALQKVRGEAEFRSLVLAAKRISNIVQDAAEYTFQEELLVEVAEIELAEVVSEVRRQVTDAVAERQYENGMLAMVRLVAPLDRFFAEVLVMDERDERRQNRIALLQRCRRVFWRVARLQAMVVERSDD